MGETQDITGSLLNLDKALSEDTEKSKKRKQFNLTISGFEQRLAKVLGNNKNYFDRLAKYLEDKKAPWKGLVRLVDHANRQRTLAIIRNSIKPEFYREPIPENPASPIPPETLQIIMDLENILKQADKIEETIVSLVKNYDEFNEAQVTEFLADINSKLTKFEADLPKHLNNLDETSADTAQKSLN